MIIKIYPSSWVNEGTEEGKALISLIKNLKLLTRKPGDYVDIIDSIEITNENGDVV